MQPDKTQFGGAKVGSPFEESALEETESSEGKAGATVGGEEDSSGWSCGVEGCRPKPGDDELAAALESVNLGYLLTRGANNSGGNGGNIGGAGDCVGLNATGDWASILSLGEQQRLAFARLVLAAPPVALLDEATSALDSKNEARMYGLLRGLPDTSYVSVGHRDSLIGYHDEILRLEGDSSWRTLRADVYKEELSLEER